MRIAIAGDFFRYQGAVARLDSSLFSDADQVFVNLEGPVTHRAKPTPKTGPNLRMGVDALDHLLEAGITGVTLANNHILDYGLHGLEETLDHCETRGLLTVGAATEMARMDLPLVLHQDGLSVAVHCFAEQEWNSVGGVGANIASTVRVARALRESAARYDASILVLHGGNENYPLPSPATVDELRFFAEMGASAIVMHHTHCMSGSEVWNGVPIYYGLGNLQFTHDSAGAEWRRGICVHLDIGSNGSILAEHAFVGMDPASHDVSALEGMELDMAQSEFGQRSHVIAAADELESSWRGFIEDHKRSYLQLVTPWPGAGRQSYRARAAVALTVLTRLSTSRALLLNTVRCQAHQTALKGVLEASLAHWSVERGAVDGR